VNVCFGRKADIYGGRLNDRKWRAAERVLAIGGLKAEFFMTARRLRHVLHLATRLVHLRRAFL
jgi:hypothetical protein